MAFRVDLAPQAIDDLDRIAEHIEQEAGFAAAEKWFNEILDSIRSLEAMHKRCRIAKESNQLGREVRVLLHGHKKRAYKVYFAISLDTGPIPVIRVFHVRHWARRPASSSYLEKSASNAEMD